MRSVIFCLTACLGAVLATPNGISRRWDKINRAIYLLSNDPNGAHVLAFALDQNNGQVSSPTLTSTGGVGLVGLYEGPPFGPPGSPAGPDSMFSQGAVRVADDLLFTVNAGSHTLAMFIIDPNDPLHPRLVGQPIDTQGEFPNSVAYSKKHKVVCVVNSGAKAGVGCFDVDHSKGLKPRGSLRPLAELQQATPPTGPRITSSDITYNIDNTAILVTVKGSPPTQPGWIYGFSVSPNGDVASTPVVSQIDDVLSDFSINFLGSNSKALITDPTFGASLVNVDSNLKVTEINHVVVPFEGNECWCVYSKRYNNAWIIDSKRTNITILDPGTGAIKGELTFDSDALGAFDTVLNRDWLYFHTVDNSVIVMQVNGTGGQQVQKFPLGQYGPDKKWQGMASWPAHQNE